MQTIDVIQGTESWRAARKNYFTASEAAAMMGVGYTSRDDLLKQKKTGVSPEISPHLQILFDKGHATEALARPLAEDALGDDFYPVTGVSDCGKYLASFDGLTMDEGLGFEHKLLNQKVVEQIQAEELEPKYYWQLEHQMMVSGAEAILFVCSDGTEKNFHSLIYTAVKGRRETLIAGWTLFEQDLAEYTLSEVVPVLEGAFIPALPSLAVELVGEVRSSNFPAYRDQALELIASVNTELEDDQDFVDAENIVKFFKDAEKKLASAKEAWLAQTGSLDDLMRENDNVRGAMATKRLQLEKLVKSEKTNRRNSIIREAADAMEVHMATLHPGVGGLRIPQPVTDFAGVMKGKRLLSAMQEAVNNELIGAKLEANATAGLMRQNLELYGDLAEGHEALFPDLQTLVLKLSDDMVAVIKSRIADFKETERRKAEQKREREAETERRRLAEEEQQREADEAVPEPAPEPVIEPEPLPEAAEIHAGRELTAYERGYIDGLRMRDNQFKTMEYPPTVAEVIAGIIRKKAA